MNDINRLKYKLNYDFGVFGSYVENFMSKLYGNSTEYLNNSAFTDKDLWDFFWERDSSINEIIWFRSCSIDLSKIAWTSAV